MLDNRTEHRFVSIVPAYAKKLLEQVGWEKKRDLAGLPPIQGIERV